MVSENTERRDSGEAETTAGTPAQPTPQPSDQPAAETPPPPAQQPAAAPASQPAAQQPATGEEGEREARVDAAKAFFRAMYAGDDTLDFTEPIDGGPSRSPVEEPSGACRNCAHLEQTLKETEQKAAEVESLYKRMAADFDNYRRRMEREREESVSVGVRKAMEALLPALDDLDRAMSFLSVDTPPDKLIESFQLVVKRIMGCLEQTGVKQLDAVGQQFDPKFHEPVTQVETTEHADGTIVQELRRGYMINDKVLRPSLVNVASNPEGLAAPAAGAAQPGADGAARGGESDHAVVSGDHRAVTDEKPASVGKEIETEDEERAVKVFDLGEAEDV